MSYKHGGFNIVDSSAPGLKRITTVGKGSIPVSLSGTYTSVGTAMAIIDRHNSSKGVATHGKKE